MNVKELSLNICRYGVLTVLSVLIVYPLIWLVSASLKNKNEFYTNVWGLPKKYQFENYKIAFKTAGIAKNFWNTLFVVSIALVFIILISFLASYAFSRIKFRGSLFLNVMFVSAMMIPIQIILIPLYDLERKIGTMNTLWGLILPYISGGLPFSIFILTGFLGALPRELDEAATIDGSSRVRTAFTILFPLARPGIATIVIFQFMNIWNDMFLPLVFIQNPRLSTLTLGLMKFNEQYATVDFTKLFAAVIIINIPIILVYVIFNRQFINGLTSGSVKS
jgi:ABC-type glycerol-3-phosphate transport system permease component